MVSNRIKSRLKAKGKRFFACDNISEEIQFGERDELIIELTDKFESVLQSLIIDTENDPNSKGTAKRLAKMYVNELMAGRYYPQPEVTAFPNEGEEAYTGMLVVRAEIRSLCAHHHQYIKGLCYIGIIPSNKVIGLSKYIRIAQWISRRGSLQEELTASIIKKIKEVSSCEDVGVHMVLSHGCCEQRGVLASDSKTQTTLLSGMFHEADIKKEFFDNIMRQGTS